MIDQGKISVLNKSSHRDQTSFSEGLMSVVAGLLGLTMGILGFISRNPPSRYAAHKTVESSAIPPSKGGLNRTTYAPQSSKKRKREVIKTTKPEAHKAKVKAELDSHHSNLKQAGCYTPQAGIAPDDGAKFLGKVTPKSGTPPDRPATQGAPGITSIQNGQMPNLQPRVAPPKPSRKDPNDGPLNGFGIGI